MSATAGPRRFRALRILVGIVCMALFVAVAWLVLSRFAGGWGVPYFSFTTANGSACTNTWTGYRCDTVTPADLQLYTGALPAGTTITSARLSVTHEYSLDAVLTTDAKHAAATGKALQSQYGRCGPGPIPSQLAKAKSVCRMSSDVGGSTTRPSARIYAVTTGIVGGGKRLTVVHIESR